MTGVKHILHVGRGQGLGPYIRHWFQTQAAVELDTALQLTNCCLEFTQQLPKWLNASPKRKRRLQRNWRLLHLLMKKGFKQLEDTLELSLSSTSTDSTDTSIEQLYPQFSPDLLQELAMKRNYLKRLWRIVRAGCRDVAEQEVLKQLSGKFFLKHVFFEIYKAEDMEEFLEHFARLWTQHDIQHRDQSFLAACLTQALELSSPTRKWRAAQQEKTAIQQEKTAIQQEKTAIQQENIKLRLENERLRKLLEQQQENPQKQKIVYSSQIEEDIEEDEESVEFKAPPLKRKRK